MMEPLAAGRWQSTNPQGFSDDLREEAIEATSCIEN